MSSLQSAIGNILNIKPIIKLIDGKLELLEKVRGRNNALTKVMSYIPDDVEKISICHILNLEEALKIKGSLEKKYPQAIITVDDLGPVIGSHLGPKTIGFCFY